MLILEAVAIAATLGLLWLCIAVVGDLAVGERVAAEAASRIGDPPGDGAG